MMLTINARFCGSVYVVECAGRLVAGEETSALEAALDARAREFNRLVLDCSTLTRMDSTGLGLLVRIAARMRQQHGDLRLAAPPLFLVRLLEMTKLGDILVSYPTEEEAILSFLRHKSGPKTKKGKGKRVLFLDPSADLCALVGTVLTQHGYDVQSTAFLRDARILIQVNSVDYILVGPGSPASTADSVLATLKALVPKAKALQLGTDFGGRDAHEAAESLLRVFEAPAAG